MAAKRILRPFHALINGSMATDLVSAITDATNQDNVGIQVKWTSANAVGTISVQASINWNPDLETGDWIDLSFGSPLPQPSSNNGEYLINLNQLPYPYYRVKYTRDSGTGTLDIWYCSKGLS